MTATKRDNGTDTLPDYEQRLTSLETEVPEMLATVREMSQMVDAILAEVRSWPRTGVPEFVGTFGHPAGHHRWSQRCGRFFRSESVGTRLVD